MTNFTQEIKRELMRRAPEAPEAFLAAVLDTSGGTYIRAREEPVALELYFSSENEDVAAYVLNVFESRFDIRMTLTEAVRDPKHGRNRLTFGYAGADSFAMRDTVYRARFGDEERDISYLKGAFLCGGSCTLPRGGTKTGYHLEIVFEVAADARNFLERLERLQLIGSIVRRGDRHVVYLKSREAIADFLSIIGADGALKRLEEVSARREERNEQNRRENCYAGNADKAAIASAAQAVAFEKFRGTEGYAVLSEPLKEALNARLGHPELSLSELAETLGITKSCLNHRLRRLMDLCSPR